MNPHAFRRQDLNLLRLPISPHPHYLVEQDRIFTYVSHCAMATSLREAPIHTLWWDTSDCCSIIWCIKLDSNQHPYHTFSPREGYLSDSNRWQRSDLWRLPLAPFVHCLVAETGFEPAQAAAYGRVTLSPLWTLPTMIPPLGYTNSPSLDKLVDWTKGFRRLAPIFGLGTHSRTLHHATLSKRRPTLPHGLDRSACSYQDATKTKKL